jgi:hypothetical protein
MLFYPRISDKFVNDLSTKVLLASSAVTFQQRGRPQEEAAVKTLIRQCSITQQARA